MTASDVYGSSVTGHRADTCGIQGDGIRSREREGPTTGWARPRPRLANPLRSTHRRFLVAEGPTVFAAVSRRGRDQSVSAQLGLPW